MSQVKLISTTVGAGELQGKDAQEVISYVARVSNPNNQLNFETSSGLLRYCINHQHWSIFEHASMTLEINTTRGLAAQILRHRSFTFQEFSQRYADTQLLEDEIPLPDIRRQDTKNRQNSIDDIEESKVDYYHTLIRNHYDESLRLYNELLEDGVAKDCARFVLPLSVPTRIYMTGSCRSWVHYIQLRSSNGTQKEHMEIAENCREVFGQVFPDVAKALEW